MTDKIISENHIRNLMSDVGTEVFNYIVLSFNKDAKDNLSKINNIVLTEEHIIKGNALQEIEKILYICHTLKGMAYCVGAKILGDTCSQIEEMTKKVKLEPTNKNILIRYAKEFNLLKKPLENLVENSVEKLKAWSNNNELIK